VEAGLGATELEIDAEEAASWLEAVATPKIHGSSLQLYYAPAAGAGVVYGRRHAFLPPGTDHYGARGVGATLGLDAKLPALLAYLTDTLKPQPRATGVTVYGEVYGGLYKHPDAAPTPAATGAAAAATTKSRKPKKPKPTPTPKPVQVGVMYAPDVRIVAFDVQLELVGGAARFLDFDVARSACEHVGIPFIPVATRGDVHEVCTWAVAHAADNALAYFNPAALPLLPGNAGEGFVVRLVHEAEAADGVRALAKIKNLTFSEVGTGADAATASLDAAEAAATVVAHKYLNAPRAASVVSKLDVADVTPRNLKALTEALMADARAEPLLTADEAAAVADGKGAKVFWKRASDVMYHFLATH